MFLKENGKTSHLPINIKREKYEHKSLTVHMVPMCRLSLIDYVFTFSFRQHRHTFTAGFVKDKLEAWQRSLLKPSQSGNTNQRT